MTLLIACRLKIDLVMLDTRRACLESLGYAPQTLSETIIGGFGPSLD
ncbi:MAG: hypothetical protein RDU20_19115 [Desulfomonilaceae bacterium]|nr:hypothetical protein [Desulfomonilaceae bacterium]